MKPYYYRMSISEFRKTFSGKPPCVNTIKKWISEGVISGDILGTSYFVHVDVNGDVIKRKPLNSSNELLKKILQP